MEILLGFLLPILLLIFVWTFRGHRRFPTLPPKIIATLPFFAGTLVMVWCLAALAFIVSSAPETSDEVQIAWKGLTSKGSSLTIGGPEETSVIGWPNEARSPKVTLTRKGPETSVEISDSTAFLLDEGGINCHNGQILEESISISFASGGVSYDFARVPDWIIWEKIEIRKDGELLSSIPVRFDDKTVGLSALLAVHSDTLAEADPRFRPLEDLKRWSQEIRVIRRSSGEIRLLSRELSSTIVCSGTCDYRLRWASGSIPFQVGPVGGDKIRLDFLRPYRSLSPRPPAEAKDTLLITGLPLSGDFAFVLPLGQLEPLRNEVAIKQDANGRYALSLPGTAAPSQTGGPYGIRLRSSGEDTLIEGKNVDLAFTIIEEAFRPGTLWALIGISSLLFVLGLAAAVRRLPSEKAWTVSAIASVLWAILTIRLLFALRFSIEIAYLDGNGISGLILSLVTLTLLPCLVFVLAMFVRDGEFEDSRFSVGSGLLLTGLAASAYQVIKANDLWSDIPEKYEFGLGWAGWTAAIAMAMVLIILIALKASRPHLYASVHRFVEELPYNVFAKISNFWHKTIYQPLPQQLVRLAALFLIAVALMILGGLVAYFLPTKKAIPQVLVPIPIYLVIILLLLSLGLITRTLGWLLSTAIAFGVSVILLLLIPLLLNDHGNVMASVALIVGLMVVLTIAGLVKGKGNIGRIGLCMAGVLLAGGLIFQLFVWDVLPISSLPKTTYARMLAYQKGRDVQHYLLTSETGKDAEGLLYRDLIFVSQHVWANQAMSHEGGILGFGFGRAPVRNSPIRLDTIRYDSLYSFYVLGEFGLVGGISLLLLFLCPVFILLYGGRSHFDAGAAAALVIFLLLFLEAATHAAMNLSILPMTGRNFPLLAVGSFGGDALRWIILITIACIAMFWGLDGNPQNRETSEPILELNGLSRRSPRKEFFWSGLQFGAILLVPLIASIVVFATMISLKWDEELDSPLTLDRLKRDVESLIDGGVVYVDGSGENVTLRYQEERFDKEQLGTTLDRKMIVQQIAKFNALPLPQKLGDRTNQPIDGNELTAATSRQDYLAFLTKVRNRPTTQSGIAPTNLFRLVKIDRRDEEDQPVSANEHTVVFNPDFDTSITFKDPNERNSIPKVFYLGDKQEIIGPAWVRGRWLTAFRRDPDGLPWIDYLATSLKQSVRNNKDIQKLAVLTVDKALQTNVQRFIEQKGGELQQSRLSQTANSKNLEDKLPPRVGLTVLRLGEGGGANVPHQNGEILALGSFPRALPGGTWSERTDLPPARVIESVFPAELQRRYIGDRNFEANLVMGSATKPIWAAAVLGVHSELNTQLQTQGREARENSIFGIKVVKDEDPDRFWSVTPGPWVGFDRYLARSDNRYHVRLGFLGIAEKAGGDVQLSQTQTGSINESINGATPRPIGRIPLFAENVFSPGRPETIGNLDTTPLALKLQTMYGASVTSGSDRLSGGYRRQLFSFWSKNEQDDRRPAEGSAGNISPASSFLHLIMPVRVDLELDKVDNPRDLVSLLLGGGSNRWSNVQVASAFAACVIGRPIMPHIVKNTDTPQFSEDRQNNFVEVSRKLHAGLTGVIFDGTATAKLRETQALGFLEELRRRGYEIYGKTGTLSTPSVSPNRSPLPPTSRFVLAIVKFSDKQQGKVSSGLVFSIFGEQAGQHAADLWLGQFINQNREAILRALGESVKPTAPAPSDSRPAPRRRSRR